MCKLGGGGGSVHYTLIICLQQLSNISYKYINKNILIILN